MFGSGMCKVDGVGETVDIDLHRIEGRSVFRLSGVVWWAKLSRLHRIARSG